MIPFYGTDTYDARGWDLDRAVTSVTAQGKGRSLLVDEHGLNILKQDLMFNLSRGEPYTSAPANPTVITDDLYAI